MSARTILITGASGAVGEVLVSHFLGKGDTVVGIVRREESAAALNARHRGRSNALVALAFDLTAAGAPQAVVAELGNRGLQPTAAVHSARSLTFLATGDDGLVGREAFLSEYLLDVVVPYELTMALALERGSRLGSVVNVGSQYGVVAVNPGLYPSQHAASPVHYGVAKAGLVHLTRELAIRLAARGVRVNCVSYGGIEGRASVQFKEQYARFCPQGRMLTERDIAGPVEFLVSDASSGATGHNLVVDGGWTAW